MHQFAGCVISLHALVRRKRYIVTCTSLQDAFYRYMHQFAGSVTSLQSLLQDAFYRYMHLFAGCVASLHALVYRIASPTMVQAFPLHALVAVLLIFAYCYRKLTQGKKWTSSHPRDKIGRNSRQPFRTTWLEIFTKSQLEHSHLPSSRFARLVCQSEQFY